MAVSDRRKGAWAPGGVMFVALALAVVPAEAAGPTKEPAFAGAKSYAVWRQPWDAALAHLNGDGETDLAVAGREADDVSVLRNRGDGTFGKPVPFQVSISPAPVVAVDFDGDDDPDLAVANQGSADGFTFAVFRPDERRNGAFEPKADYEVGRFPEDLAAEDLDGVGDADLATANLSLGDAAVLRNRGDGIFARPVRYDVGCFPGDVAAADLGATRSPTSRSRAPVPAPSPSS